MNTSRLRHDLVVPVHTIAEGESIFKLAHDNGLCWKTIWEHEDNEALRENCRNPGTLTAGLECFIPEREQHEDGYARGGFHSFRVRRPPTQLRLKMHRGRQALANLDFVLEVGNLTIQGTTGGEGEIDKVLPANATQGTLRLGDAEYVLQLNSLAPFSTELGLQQRLENLGFWCGGDQPGAAGVGTLAALNEWRTRQQLDATDAIAMEHMEALRDAHGC